MNRIFVAIYIITVTSGFQAPSIRPCNPPGASYKATRGVGSLFASSAAGAAAELEALKTSVLYSAATTTSTDPSTVVDALLTAEKLTKSINKELISPSASLRPRLAGSWRLIFTTGTLKTQEKVGRVNYFPLKAVQSFTADGGISNAIYLFGGAPVIKFEGAYELVEVGASVVRVEFDFGSVRLLDAFDIKLGGGALEVGERTGLGSGTGIGKDDGKKKGEFVCLSAMILPCRC